MDIKYCTLSDEQVDAIVRKLHSKVHVLLPYSEDGFEDLDGYFESLLSYVGALNDVLGRPPCLPELLVKIRVARNQNARGNFKAFRRAVLDAHEVINKIRG